MARSASIPTSPVIFTGEAAGRIAAGCEGSAIASQRPARTLFCVILERSEESRIPPAAERNVSLAMTKKIKRLNPNPPKIKLGQIIARRILTEYTGDMIRTVAVSIGAPRPWPKSDWVCPFLIEGREKPQVEPAFGVDALQALLLAVEGIRVRLDETGSRFEWLDPSGPWIPRLVPTGQGKRFEQRINQLIDRETARHWEARLRARKARLAEFEAELKQRKKTVAQWEAVLKRRKAM
jgi:hypothetical protein